MLNGNDRRKYVRVNLPIALQYKNAKDGLDPFKNCVIKDIGEGGLRFTTDGFVPLACHMVVKIDINQAEEPIRAILKVKWIKKLADGVSFEIGNEFSNISSGAKAVLSDFLKRNQRAKRVFAN